MENLDSVSGIPLIIKRFQFSPNNDLLAVHGQQLDGTFVVEVFAGNGHKSVSKRLCDETSVFAWTSSTSILISDRFGELYDGSKAVVVPFDQKLTSRQWQQIVVHEEQLTAAITASEVALIRNGVVSRVVTFSNRSDEIITCAAFHPSGAALAIGALRNGCVYIVDVATGKRMDLKAQLASPTVMQSESCLNQIKLKSFPVDLSWSKYGEQLAMVDSETLTLWNVPTGNLEVTPLMRGISGVTFCSDAAVVVADSSGLCLVDIDEGTVSRHDEDESRGNVCWQRNFGSYLAKNNAINRFKLIT